MNQLVKIKNSLLILMLVFSTAYAEKNIQIENFEKNEDYLVRDIDINKDGVLDKVISSEKYKGDELYLFLHNNGKYTFVLKSINFTEDGGNVIDDIKALNDANNVFTIDTFFPDRGSYEIRYFISFKDSKWFLTKTEYKTSSWQNDYTKSYICDVQQNIDLNELGSDNWFDKINHIPPEDKRDDMCNINFYMENTLEEFIKRFKSDNQSIVKGINRYVALIGKFPLSLKTLLTYNNIAYYLQKTGANKESIYLLEKILKKYPNRTVAYYNIGDAYWELGDKEKAKQAYSTYIKQMKAKGKEKRIPRTLIKRVQE